MSLAPPQTVQDAQTAQIAQPASHTAATPGTPFRKTVVSLLLAVGVSAFVALLYALGAGSPLPTDGNGQGHAASNSVVGYRALYRLVEATGTPVRTVRSAADYDAEGLLVLTPPAHADPEELAKIVESRRHNGPTLIILPKWIAAPLPARTAGTKKGWVVLDSAPLPGKVSAAPLSALFEDAAVKQQRAAARLRDGRGTAWGTPPAKVRTVKFGGILGLVENGSEGIVIGYPDDDGSYPDIDRMAGYDSGPDDPDLGIFPVIVAADPDMFNNMGLEKRTAAKRALDLMAVFASDTLEDTVFFDVTLNGLGARRNLLTLAFEPPFLAATMSLIAAAIAAILIGLNRFGAPLREARELRFGKAGLVTNSAALAVRLGRKDILSRRYADIALDRACAARGVDRAMPREDRIKRLSIFDSRDEPSFSELLSALESAANVHDAARRAAAVDQWIRTRQ